MAEDILYLRELSQLRPPRCKKEAARKEAKGNLRYKCEAVTVAGGLWRYWYRVARAVVLINQLRGR